MSCKEMLQRRIVMLRGVTRKDVTSFLGDNWPFLLRVGLYTIPSDIGVCRWGGRD